MKKITRQQANCFINIFLFRYTIRLGTQNTAPAQSSSFHPITRRHQSQLGTPRYIECFCWRKCNSLIFIIADTERKRKGFVRGWIIVQHLLSTLQSLPQSVSTIDVSVCSRALAWPALAVTRCHKLFDFPFGLTFIMAATNWPIGQPGKHVVTLGHETWDTIFVPPAWCYNVTCKHVPN